MSDLTDADLAAMKARADVASPGPWNLMSARPDGRLAIERPDYNPFTNEVSSALLVYDTNPEDAEFIAHARADVPALLVEVAALRKQIDLADKCIEEIRLYFETNYYKGIYRSIERYDAAKEALK